MAAEDLERRTKALRAQIDPLGAAQAKLNAELAEANALFKAGAISAQEQAAAHQLAQTRFNATAKALKGLGDGSRLASYQVVNLGYQLNDVVVGLASGQRPLTVLMQQGSQIAQVFAGTGMGVGGVLAVDAADAPDIAAQIEGSSIVGSVVRQIDERRVIID